MLSSPWWTRAMLLGPFSFPTGRVYIQNIRVVTLLSISEELQFLSWRNPSLFIDLFLVSPRLRGGLGSREA